MGKKKKGLSKLFDKAIKFNNSGNNYRLNNNNSKSYAKAVLKKKRK